MSISRAVNTVSRYTLFGAVIGCGFGSLSEMSQPHSGDYNMTGLTTLLLMGTSASAGFVLGVGRALFDLYSAPAEEHSICLMRKAQ